MPRKNMFAIRRLVRWLSAWAWKDELKTVAECGGVLKWTSLDDWWRWYVVEVGTAGGHDVTGHGYPIVRKAWDAARERGITCTDA
jgi:hypothetical protein